MSSPSRTAPEREQGSAQEFGWALGTLLRAYHKQAGEALADLPGGPRGYQVLSIVARDACHNQAAIAEYLGLDRTVVTYLLDGLEGEELVLRQPDPADRRSRQVRLTPKGAKLFAELSRRIARVEESLLGGFTDSEAELLRTMLNRAARAADPEAGPADACAGAETQAACEAAS